MRKSFTTGLVFLYFSFFFTGLAHGQNNIYFSDNKYAEYPIITLQENFWGNPVYSINGEKIKASEVRAYMEIMPGDASQFMDNHRKAITGTGLNLAGTGLIIGAFGYAFDNRNNLNNQIVRNWFIPTVIGGVVGGIGGAMNRNGVYKINGLIENHNYLIRQEEISGPYLKMRVASNFIGEKLEIYEGPSLLTKQEVNQYFKGDPELFAAIKKIQRSQNLSLGLDIMSFATSLVLIYYVISPQFQSSTPSNFIIPLTLFDVGLTISSSMIRRNNRNKTRLILQQFNFNN